MTRETENAAFVNRIVETPDEDAVRLVYADWLDESGEPERAELIRVQIAIETADDEERTRLRSRVQSLLSRFERTWTAGFSGLGVYRLRWRRGFVEEIYSTATAFVRRGAVWSAQTPLRSVQLAAASGRAYKIGGCRHLKGIEALTIHDRDFDDADLSNLARSPNAPALQSLTLGVREMPRLGLGRPNYSGAVGHSGVEALARSGFCRGLTQLRIFTHQPIGAALPALLGGSALPSARYLTLRGELGNAGARAVADSSVFGQLVHLSLPANAIEDAGALRILGSKRAVRLESLELPWNALTPGLFNWLTVNEPPPQLRVFHLPWEVTADVPALSLAALGDRHPGVDFGLSGLRHGAEATLDRERLAQDSSGE